MNVDIPPVEERTFSVAQIASNGFTCNPNMANVYKCKSCGNEYLQTSAARNSNLARHFKTHPNWRTFMPGNDLVQAVIQPLMSKEEADNWFLAQLIIFKLQPLSDCDDALYREHMTSLVGSKKMKQMLFLLKNDVEGVIADELPAKFGIIFDGWTENYCSYVAVFATFPGLDDQPKLALLGFVPIGKENGKRDSRTH